MSQALLVRPDSPHNYPGSLAGVPLAVQFHSGSHYTALRLLEGYLTPEQIRLEHWGPPMRRFEAMWNGEVAGCLLMEPFIALAEKLGCKTLCEAHYLGLQSVAEDVDPQTFAAMRRAVDAAIDLFNADKRKYLHYLIDDPRYSPLLQRHGGLTPQDFHLPRLRYTKSCDYDAELLDETTRWMRRWGLLNADGSLRELLGTGR